MTFQFARRIVVVALVALGAPCATSAQSRPSRRAMLVSEDARDTASASVGPLVDAALGPDSLLQAIATRGIGRFERVFYVQGFARGLHAASASVRLEAANAMAQSLQQAIPADSLATLGAMVLLSTALDEERDNEVAGIVALSLGRLPYRSGTTIREVGATLVKAASRPNTDTALSLGVLRGLESLLRTHRDSPIADETIAFLRNARGTAEMRRLALAALTSARRMDSTTVARALTDADEQVRRLAVLAVAADTALPSRLSVIRLALADRSAMVRYDALRAYGRSWSSRDCAPTLAHVRDTGPYVSLLAIDLLGTSCSDARASDTLVAIARALPPNAPVDAPRRLAMHRAAHAFVALAVRDSALAASIIERFVTHPAWQVRMYAGRASEAMKHGEALDVLSHDSMPNVRTAALEGLARTYRHEADHALVEALTSHDYQVVLTGANGLSGALDRGPAVAAAIAALERITAERKETSRDPRMALLARLAQLGTSALAPRLQPLLSDFDPLIADSTAALLTRWMTTPQHATPRLLPKPAIDAGEIERLRGARLSVTMRGGGRAVVRLLPDEAPVTVLRIASLARAHRYDGLTFHRVVPNFVIQGGSPGANEYVGHDPFLRDEVWLRTHARGTLGISTRGRDTGDSQIFVNTVDNPRLDFGYTVFGVVESGMDVFDRVLEGDVIEKIEVVGAAK